MSYEVKGILCLSRRHALTKGMTLIHAKDNANDTRLFLPKDNADDNRVVTIFGTFAKNRCLCFLRLILSEVGIFNIDESQRWNQ